MSSWRTDPEWLAVLAEQTQRGVARAVHYLEFAERQLKWAVRAHAAVNGRLHGSNAALVRRLVPRYQFIGTPDSPFAVGVRRASGVNGYNNRGMRKAHNRAVHKSFGPKDTHNGKSQE